MSNIRSEAYIQARRGELLVELFLQDIGAMFLAKPDSDLGVDFLVAFENRSGGLSLSAVEVKVTGQPVPEKFPLARRTYARLANANVPGLLLVVDVKQNRIFHAWPNAEFLKGRAERNTISVSLAEIDVAAKESIRGLLAGEKSGPPAN
jgi:hypothetical protein